MKRSCIALSNICTILFCAARFIHNVRFLLLSTWTQFIMSQISSTLDKDAKRRKCTYRHRLPVMHVCIYQYTYCTPGTYYVLTAVVFLAQLQREIASKTNAVLLLLYSYLKKKEEDNLHGINCTYRIDIERYTSTCMQGCSTVAICSAKQSSYERKLRVCIISITNSIYKY